MSSSEILNLIDNPVIFDEMTKELFKKVDKDNTLTLDKHELRLLLVEFAETLEIRKPSEDDVDDILLGFDNDGNCSSLSYEEFKTLLNRLIKQIINIIS